MNNFYSLAQIIVKKYRYFNSFVWVYIYLADETRDWNNQKYK